MILQINVDYSNIVWDRMLYVWLFCGNIVMICHDKSNALFYYDYNYFWLMYFLLNGMNWRNHQNKILASHQDQDLIGTASYDGYVKVLWWDWEHCLVPGHYRNQNPLVQNPYA